ncbi:MAG: NAD-dependent epimerase/dehydratase family protein [Chloroflexota bacterium]
MATQHIIFGTGPLGQSVMRALRKRQDVQVTMVNRSGKRTGIPDDVQVITGDAYDEAKVRDITKDADVVYQCAQPAYNKWAEQFPPLQTAILNGVSANHAKLVVGENLYMYGDTNGQVITVNLPYRPHGTKGTVRATMTDELLSAHQAGKVRVAIARGSDFYGEGVRESLMGERVFEFMLEGKPASVFGKIDLPHTQTYISDFGEAMAILGERDEALGRAWHVPNAEPKITMRQFIERIAQAMGIEARVSVMPKIMFETISLFHPMLREFRELRYELEKPYVVDSSEFIARFGDISTPIDEGIRNTVAWYRD